MAKILTPIQAELVSITVPRMARIYEIHRIDGEILYFAAHSTIITFGGNDYSPMDGFDTAATQEMTNLDESNSEIAGLLSDSRITAADLRAGRYEDALIIERVVDWLTPNRGGELYKRHWWIGRVSWDGERWQASVKGLASWLSESSGLLSNRSCRFNLGDNKCGIDLAAYTQNGTVGTVVNTRRSFQSNVSASVPENTTGSNDQWFRDGLITFTSADDTRLVGLTFQVRSFVEADGVFVTREKIPFDVTAGDEFTVYPGCNKSVNHCKVKFDNYLRFGGDPFIPGGDKASESPSSTD